MNIDAIVSDLQSHGSTEKAVILAGFFKTGKGQYGEGDVFFGVNVPTLRLLTKKYQHLSFEILHHALIHSVHEVRLFALLLLVKRYQQAQEADRATVIDFYLSHCTYINNWDLVDASAPFILGDFLRTRDRSLLRTLALTDHLWSQRIAIVATFALIRDGQYDDTLILARLFLDHPHDLIQKATGWMLREIGKRNCEVLIKFLDQYSASMPRTMLRYALEKFDEPVRQHYLHMKFAR